MIHPYISFGICIYLQYLSSEKRNGKHVLELRLNEDQKLIKNITCERALNLGIWKFQ